MHAYLSVKQTVMRRRRMRQETGPISLITTFRIKDEVGLNTSARGASDPHAQRDQDADPAHLARFRHPPRG